MTARLCSPEKILAVAEPEGPQIALDSALRLAEAHGAAVEVIACIDPPHDLSLLSRLSDIHPDRLIDGAVDRAQDAVRTRLNEVAPDRAVSVSVSVGKTYLQIIRHVAATGCDFVIKRAEPLAGLDRFLFSSTDQHLLRKCPCPVWLQTAGGAVRPKRVLAAVDLEVTEADEPETLAALNRRVVQTACQIADGSDAEVGLLHAWDAVGEGMIWAFSGGTAARMSADHYVNELMAVRHQAMADFIAQMRRDIGPSPRLVAHLVRGAPQTVIQDQRRQVAADVVVMGTVARTGLSGVFIGNTAENIINSLDCPVLAVKPDGFVSPLLAG